MTSIIIILAMGALVAGLGYFFYEKFKKEVVKVDEKESRIPTTQDNIPIDYVRDGIVRMKNGSYVAIVSIPSINIDLMEDDEREVVLQQYRQILNAMEHPFQYIQQSRVVDISEYLRKIEKVREESDNVFIEKQLDFYSSFLVDLVKTKAVLTKKFYIAVSYDLQLEKMKKNKNKTGMFDFETKKKLDKKDNEVKSVLDEEKEFNEARKELKVRAGDIVKLFSRLGVKPEVIHDDEIVELFYASYNKSRSVYQGLPKNINATSTTLYVKRG